MAGVAYKLPVDTRNRIHPVFQSQNASRIHSDIQSLNAFCVIESLDALAKHRHYVSLAYTIDYENSAFNSIWNRLLELHDDLHDDFPLPNLKPL